MASNFVKKEKAEGMFNGEQVRFNREWGGHRFTDDEVDKLLAGDNIHFSAKSKAGNTYEAYGYLAHQTFINSQGDEVPFVGFKLDFDLAPDTVPASFCGHKFTAAEKSVLEKGNVLHLTDLVSKRTGNTFEADLKWGEDKDNPGRKRINLSFD